MLLSLIIPFFNSEHNSKRLLETLAGMHQQDIEFILINDGSCDNTYDILKAFKASNSKSNVVLIDQENKGPGGARNAGTRIAKGKYIWFVDSDDDITLDAINVIQDNCDYNYDFIDFNVKSTKQLINSMNLPAGEYFVEENNCAELIENFGRISSKAIRRELLVENEIFYPEYCLYEDNPLRFIYPFFIRKFLKTDTIGYLHHLEFESITRSTPNSRTLDRLYTAVYGFRKGLKLANTRAEINILESKFIEKYLMETTSKFISVKPSKNWIVTWRIMKQYRDVSKKLNVKSSPFDYVKEKYSPKLRSYFIFHWLLSYLIINDQTKYFNQIREKTWNLSSIAD